MPYACCRPIEICIGHSACKLHIDVLEHDPQEPLQLGHFQHGLTLRSKLAIVRYNTRTKGDFYSTATLRSVGLLNQLEIARYKGYQPSFEVHSSSKDRKPVHYARSASNQSLKGITHCIWLPHAACTCMHGAPCVLHHVNCISHQRTIAG